MAFNSPTAQQAQGITGTNKEDKFQVAKGKYTPESTQPGTLDNTFDDSFNTPAGLDSNDDSGFFDNEDSYSHRPDYDDFTLYPGNYPAVDTSKFFADADLALQDNDASYHDFSQPDSQTDTASTSTQHNAHENQTTHIYDPIHEAADNAMDEDIFQAVQAMNDYHIDSSLPRTESILTPLQTWVSNFERHESIAYRFEQPPYPERFFSQ